MLLSMPDDARLEIKFSAYEFQLDTILKWINMHSAGFKVPYPNRAVNNVYFDTHDYASYVQNLSGESARIKLRYRWYGQSCEPDQGNLEVKCKRNYFGWKLHFPCPKLRIEKQNSWHVIKRNLVEQLSPEGRLWLNTYSTPILINRYLRRYFLSSDNKVRVTVDTQQAVWDQRFKSQPNYDRKANLTPNLVVEIKLDRKDRLLASHLIQSMPIRVSRHSKYMNGVQAISNM